MAKQKLRLPVTLSALFATLLSCGLAMLVTNKISIWNSLGTGEKVWTIFASTYAIVLTVSGWLYGVLESRVLGIIHVVLMLGIAGMVMYGFLSGFISSPGSDNAAAGIVATANLVFIIIGVLAAICGVLVIRCVSPRKETHANPQ